MRPAGVSFGRALSATVVVAAGLCLAACGDPGHTATEAAGARSEVLFASLEGVTCPDTSHCVAVGDFLPADKDAASGDPDGDGKATHTLVESSDGTRWVHVPSPDEGRGGSQLSSVSCPGLDSCTAVGFYRPDPFPAYAASAPPSVPLIESEKHGRWQIVASPRPASDSVLVGVSCPTIADCTAVGYSILGESGANPIESPFAERLQGQSWTLDPLSLPSGTDSGLNAVSCPSVSDCVAVGDLAPAADPTTMHPLVEMMEDGIWTRAVLPSGGSGQGVLYDVSCPGVGQCVAAGNSTAGTTGSALVLSLDGTTWSVNRAASNQAGDPSLTSIGCADIGHCVVAGTALESAGKVVAQVDATGWQPLPPPTFADNVESIACPTDSSCVVVGSQYVNGLGNTSALIASLSARVWTAERSPDL